MAGRISPIESSASLTPLRPYRYSVAARSSIVIPALLLPTALLAAPLRDESFQLAQASEVVAVVTAACERCAWGRKGREAAALRLDVDGRYSQHLLLVQGAASSEYRVALGSLPPGAHRLGVAVDRAASADGVRRVSVEKVELLKTPTGAGESAALAHAPVFLASGDVRARFSALPLLLWYQSERTARGTRIRYSVVLSSAAAPPDRLMAGWGRATDITPVHSVELDSAGRTLAEEGPPQGMTSLRFAGAHDGSHPLLELSPPGADPGQPAGSPERYAPAPFAFGFVGASQEAVMDAHPWTYRVMIQEAGRRGLLVADARQGSGRIPDPRRFAYVEACGELSAAALALDVGVSGRGGHVRWRASDSAGPAFRIERSGCFRAAVALGSPAETASIQAIRFRAYALPKASSAARVRLTGVNRVFVLRNDGTPGPNLFTWEGDASLSPGGAPYTLELGRRR